MLVLREEDIETILGALSRPQCEHLAAALWRTLESYSQGDTENSTGNSVKLVHQPMRERIVTAKSHTTLFMPASDTANTTGIKTVTLPGNGGAPKGAINVFAPDGALEGLLNAELITAFRTALASMIPFCRHRLPDRANVVVFGAGKQAEWHIRLSLLLSHEKITRITVINRGSAGLERLRTALEDPPWPAAFSDVSLVSVSRDSPDFNGQLREAVSQADAIFCCTPSTEPLFPGSYLQDQPDSQNRVKPRFISLIGSYTPQMQEIDTQTLLSGGKILVDSIEACVKEAGELTRAGVTADQLVEIGELPNPFLENTKQDDAAQGTTVFKCVGMGIMDLVIGRELLRIAQERALGVDVDRF